jgi:hypothetical protein
MNRRNTKDKKQSGYRKVAAGIERKIHNKADYVVEKLTSKKKHAKETAENKTRAERKARVGKPQSFLLGNRTRTEKGRIGYGRRDNRLAHMFEWGDSAAGSKKIPKFMGESAKSHLTLLVRFLFTNNFTFFDDEWRHMIITYFVYQYNLSPQEPLPQMRTRLASIKRDERLMRIAVARFGPAFLPNGLVKKPDNSVVKIHNIPIKDGHLHRAQAKFAEIQADNVKELHRSIVSNPIKVVGGMESSRVKVGKPSPPGIQKPPKSVPSSKKKDKTVTISVPTDTQSGKKIQRLIDTCQPFNFKSNLQGKSLHKVADLNNSNYLDGLKPVECGGSPFCGYVSIDLCLKIKPELDKYCKWCDDFDFDDPVDVGTPEFLNLYCRTNSVNLLILVKTENWEEDVLDEDPISSTYSAIYRTVNPDDTSWVVLLYQGGLSSVGHFMPLIAGKTLEVMPLPEPLTVKNVCFVYELSERFEKTQTLIDPSGDDHRAPQIRREKVEIEDTYSTVNYYQQLKINPFFVLLLCCYAWSIYFCYTNHVEQSLEYLRYLTRIDNAHAQILNGAWTLRALGLVAVMFEPLSLILMILAIYLFTPVLYNRYIILGLSFILKFWNVLCYLLVSTLPFSFLSGSKVETIENVAYFLKVIQFCWNYSIKFPIPEEEYKVQKFELINWFSNCMILLISSTIIFLLCHYVQKFLVEVFDYNSVSIRFEFKNMNLMVSNTVAQTIYSQLQTVPVDQVDWAFLNRMKWSNTNCTENQGIIANTKRYILYVYKTHNVNGGLVSRVLGNRGLVAINTLSSKAYISPEALNIIASNQNVGKVNGTGNYVKSMVPVQDPVKSRPVATAVIGSPRTDGGHLGPGLLPVTDQIGILTAFAARSMTYVEPEDNIIDEFVEFSKTFLQPFIDGTDCTELTDEDPIVYFRNHYRGKRSQSWIEGQINQFNFYESGLADISFDSHSCFVKLENSSKEVDGTYQLRPRLIMTMSPVMLFKCCRILAVVDRWNRGPFSRFQVKDMDPAEMIQKIMEFSDRAHTVTDYSSFESSITGRIRVIENFVIESLLAKAGMHETLRDFRNYVFGPRELRSHGLRLQIDSRCSGDPHTSCGNGIINVCIAAFCASKSNVDLNTEFIIAEGDDGITSTGLIDIDIVKRVGFKFSESVSGFYCGDTDFLRRRWINGKVYLNIGRAMSVFWVKAKANLTKDKLLFLLRCMGCSLHHMSPGHPVLYAIVKRIGLETQKAKKFNNWFLHIDMYKWPDFDVDNYPMDVECDVTMRDEIALGAIGFPPLSVSTQIELENIFLTSPDMYIGDRLNHYDDVLCYVQSLVDNESQTSIYSESVVRLLEIVGGTCLVPQHVS